MERIGEGGDSTPFFPQYPLPSVSWNLSSQLEKVLLCSLHIYVVGVFCRAAPSSGVDVSSLAPNPGLFIYLSSRERCAVKFYPHLNHWVIHFKIKVKGKRRILSTFTRKSDPSPQCWSKVGFCLWPPQIMASTPGSIICSRVFGEGSRMSKNSGAWGLKYMRQRSQFPAASVCLGTASLQPPLGFINCNLLSSEHYEGESSCLLL